MTSDTLLTLIIEWAVAPLYALVAWLTLKFFNLDKNVAVLKQEAKSREEGREKFLEAVQEHNSELVTRIENRINSMEQHLRERNNTG